MRATISSDRSLMVQPLSYFSFQPVFHDRCNKDIGMYSLSFGRKEGNVLFNDALNTFYFTVIWRRTYDIGPLR